MPAKAIVTELKTLSCSASWRNYYFVKVTTADGVRALAREVRGVSRPRPSA